MSKKFENVDQLRDEIKRLEAKSEELKTQLKNDVEGIKDYFKPVNLFFNAATSFAKMKFVRPVFSNNGFSDGIRSIIAPILEKVFDRITTAITEFIKRRKKVVHEDE